MPDAHNEFDIPVLTDVLVPGKSVLARRPWQAADAAPPHAIDLPELPPEVPPELAASGLPTLGGALACLPRMARRPRLHREDWFPRRRRRRAPRRRRSLSSSRRSR